MSPQRRRSVAVILTPSEQDAIVQAAAMHEAEFEGDGDSSPESRATDRALDSVIDKIVHAKKGP